jgi:phosphohistidine phosphatase
VLVLGLLRHAKSSWDDPGLADRERPLAPRGRNAAGRLAAHLAEEPFRPNLVLCSPARRTRETLEPLARALGEPRVEFDAVLYGANADGLLARVRSLADDVGSVLLVGHNPALQNLALALAARGERLSDLERKFPTGALAMLALDAPDWSSVQPRCATLTGFVKPRELR